MRRSVRPQGGDRKRDRLRFAVPLCIVFGCGGDDGGEGDDDGDAMASSGDAASGGSSGQGQDGAANAPAMGGAAGSDAGACAPECPVDDVRCTGQIVERCTADIAGCARWVSERDCATTGEVCAQDAVGAACAPPPGSCTDVVLNQDETDVDCGGSVCAGCAPGQACSADGDCAAGLCYGGRCVGSAPECPTVYTAPSGFSPPNSLMWPLVAKDTGAPRQALGNSFGEYQQYGAEASYLHSGLDLRGLEGDYVKVVADGNIWLTANLAQCDDFAGVACRLYIKALDGRYIYYYSHLRLSATDPMSVELRDKITNATPQGSGYAVQPGTDIRAGETLSAIADFYSNDWAHLHFTIFDASENYDGINPLLAVATEQQTPPVVDDEPPWVTNIAFRADGSTTDLAPSGACAELTGSVDVVAVMGDAYYTNDPAPAPLPGAINSIGVYEARLLVRNVTTGQAEERTWYRFDRAPLTCTGPERGTACPTTLSETDFLALTIDQPSGPPLVGGNYTATLFEGLTSSSDYANVETYTHVLTHAWAEEGAWDTSAYPDGLYQVSVEALDHGGNRTSLSRFVVVDNGGVMDPSTVKADAYVRDHEADVGALPSTLGNQPFWRSPDVLVVTAGAAVNLTTAPTTTPLVAGRDYDVYVRVHNDRCSSVAGMRVRLTSLPPDLSGDLTEGVAITAGFATDASHATGLDLGPSERSLLGPFRWTPSTTELAEFGGHRVILAEIDAPADSRNATASVADDNNATLRSVQLVGATTTTPSFVLRNPGAGRTCAQIVVESVGLPMTDPATRVRITLPYSPELEMAWQNVPGAVVTHDSAGGVTTVELVRARVSLPPILLASGQPLAGTALLEKPAGADADSGVRVSLYLEGVLASGVDLQ